MDTIAIIFPPTITRRVPTVFRLSARLKQPVNLARLQRALAQAYDRAPYFCVRLRWGFFWYFLEECTPAPVLRDDGIPCMDFPRRRVDRPLILVRARGNRIALEASHALTDGAGALVFFRTLLVYYGRLSGDTPDPSPAESRETAILPERPQAWEERYANQAVYHPGQPHPTRYPPAWHLPGPLLNPGFLRVTTGRYSAALLCSRARAMGLSITDLCLAVLIHTLQERYYAAYQPRRRRRPIRILVPVDMRRGTGLATMRNFFVTAMVEIDQRLGHYALDEIARNVHHQLRAQMDTRSLKKQVARNVGAQRNWFNRTIPIFLKDIILRVAYRLQGEAVNTASFSNLGRVELPAQTAERILDMDFLPPPSPITGVNMTLITFGDTASISFGSLREDTEVERGFFRTLAGLGLTGSLVVNWATEG